MGLWGAYAFANFDVSGRVSVRIVSKQSLSAVVIRPASSHVSQKLEDDDTMTFLLNGQSLRMQSAALCTGQGGGPEGFFVEMFGGLHGRSFYSFRFVGVVPGSEGFDARDIVVKVYYLTGGFVEAGTIE